MLETPLNNVSSKSISSKVIFILTAAILIEAISIIVLNNSHKSEILDLRQEISLIHAKIQSTPQVEASQSLFSFIAQDNCTCMNEIITLNQSILAMNETMAVFTLSNQVQLEAIYTKEELLNQTVVKINQTLSSNILSNQANITNLSFALGNLSWALAGLNNTLSNEISSTQGEVGSLSVNLEQLNQTLIAVDNNLSQQISSTQSQVGGLSINLGNLNQSLNAVDNNLSQQISSIQSQVGGLSINLGNLNQTLITVDNTLSQKISSTQSQVGSLSTEIQNVENSVQSMGFKQAVSGSSYIPNFPSSGGIIQLSINPINGYAVCTASIFAWWNQNNNPATEWIFSFNNGLWKETLNVTTIYNSNMWNTIEAFTASFPITTSVNSIFLNVDRANDDLDCMCAIVTCNLFE